MTYLSAYKTGNLVLPTELLFHFHEIFDNSDDFLVWQFFYLQNTTSLEEISPVQIAESIGKSVAEVNRSMSNLTEKGLLQYKTIALNGEIEAVFDALPALERLDEIVENHSSVAQAVSQNVLKDLVETFQQELGRLLTPFEIEDLKVFLQDHKKEVIKLAIKECVGNGKPYFKYLSSILRDWKQKGLVTAELVENRQKPTRSSGKSNGRLKLSDDGFDPRLGF